MSAEVGVAPPRSAPAERSAALLIFNVRRDAPKAATPPPPSPVEAHVDAARQTALKAVPESVSDVANQATKGATAEAVDDTARVTTQPPSQASTEKENQPLRILFSPTDEILPGRASDLRANYSLEVTAERMDALVVHCFMIGGRDALGRLARGISVAVEARQHGQADDLAWQRERLYKLPLFPVLAAEITALVESMERLNTAIVDTLIEIAAQSAAQLRHRLAVVASAAAREKYRYFGPIGPERMPPQPGGGTGSTGRERTETRTGGTGGAGGSEPTVVPKQALRARDGKEGAAARELVELVGQIGPLREAYSASAQALQSAEEARKAASATGSGTGGGGGGTGGSGGARGSGGHQEVDDAFIAQLREQTARLRGTWQERVLAVSRPPETPKPLTPGASAAYGTVPRVGGAAQTQGTKATPSHPMLPGILALCLAAEPDVGETGTSGEGAASGPGTVGSGAKGARYSEANVLKQTWRYLNSVLTITEMARHEKYSTEELAIQLTAARGSDSFPEKRAVRWALDTNKPYIVEPFASDAALMDVKSSLVQKLKDEAADDDLRTMFEYRVLVSYWESLVAERELRARPVREALERRNWWMNAIGRVSSALSLAGLFFGGPAGALATWGLRIALGQVLLVMIDAASEETSSTEAIEAVVSGDDDRLALSISTEPLLWRLGGEIAKQLGFQAALNTLFKPAGLLYEIFQDLETVVE